jgi:hypothetical protein
MNQICDRCGKVNPDDIHTCTPKAEPAQEPVSWGVDWGKAGDIPCVSIIKRLPDGGIKVLAVEYAPYSYTTPPAQPAPVQDLPFGVGGGLVAIKTLLSRDPCVHANTAIEMIDAILKEHPAAQPAPVPLTVAQKGAIHAATASMRFYEAVEFAIRKTEAAHGITKGQP